MNIPDKAIEAAAQAQHAWDVRNGTLHSKKYDNWGKLSASIRRDYHDAARLHLEAGAPFIAAQALRDAGKDLDARAGEKHAEPVVHGIMRAESTRLHNRAAELDPS